MKQAPAFVWEPDLSREFAGSNWLPPDWSDSQWGLWSGSENCCTIVLPPHLEAGSAVALEFSKKTFGAPWETVSVYYGKKFVPMNISQRAGAARMEGLLPIHNPAPGEEPVLAIFLPEARTWKTGSRPPGGFRLVHCSAGPAEMILKSQGIPDPYDFSKSWVSHAQNFEDVYLRRAFGEIKEGFYVDVGANNPFDDSITLDFYERGWNGINIEPDPDHWENLVKHRPRDINLNVAVSSTPGKLDFYHQKNSGSSTCLEQMWRLSRQPETFRKISVAARTLEDILNEHAKGDIHFMKVDVEGFEQEVLQSLDFRVHRPWVLIIEATLPGQPTPNHHFWEMDILAAGYLPATFDGLNRYYVAEEHAGLLWAFQSAPGIFDRFQTRLEVMLRNELELASKIQKDLDQQQKWDKHRMQEITQSLSWRLTKPFRLALDFSRGLVSRFRRVP